MEITQTLPQKYQIQNYTVTLNTIPHTSSNTRCHLNIPLSHFYSNTNKPKLHESCSTKSKPYSMLQIKNCLCCVKEKFRNSFVLPKKYSAKQITISLIAIIATNAHESIHRMLSMLRLSSKWKKGFLLSSPTLTSLNSTSLAAPKANHIQSCK